MITVSFTKNDKYRSEIIVVIDDTPNARVADLLYSIGLSMVPIIAPSDKNVCNTPNLITVTSNLFTNYSQNITIIKTYYKSQV